MASSSQDSFPESIPKTPNRALTYKERIQIQTLYYLADQPPRTITTKTGVPYRTVLSCISGPTTPTKRPGRPPILRTPLRSRLISHATQNATQRRKPREQIAEELGFELCSRTVKTAFKRE